jgi:4-amino-4-deoxy-L-arabinose transferase-like glycosyltransferase
LFSGLRGLLEAGKSLRSGRHDRDRLNPSARDRDSGARSGAESDALLAVLVSLLTLTAFLALFVFRAFDDNRLTSWQWAFAGVDVRAVFLILLAGVALAYPVSRLSFPGRTHAALLFVASFVLAGLFWRVPEVNVDAARYFAQAKHFELFGAGYFLREWGHEIGAWTDLPLVPLLHGLILSVFGETRAGVQAFTTLLFSATVVLTYLIGKALWDEKVGGYGAALLAGMPYLLTQVPLMLVDVPTMFFLTLAVFATIEAVRRGGVGRLALASVTIALAALSKYSAWLMLSVLPVIVLCHLDCGRAAVLRRAGALALGATLLIGAVAFLKFDVVAEQLRLLQSFQLPGLGRWGEGHASTFLFQTHPFIAVAALCSVLVAVRKRDLRFAIVGWMLLLVVVLEVERSRYVLVAFPMLALMAGYGLASVRNARTSKHVVSCTVASMLVTAIFVYLPFLQGTSAANLQHAGAYLDSIDAETVEVFALPQPRSQVNPAIAVPILDIFTHAKIAYRDDMQVAPARETIETSPVRFTWEYDLSRYLIAGSGPSSGAVVVVISGGRNPSLPEALARRIAGYRLAREFGETDRVFRYKTMVRVYRPL